MAAGALIAAAVAGVVLYLFPPSQGRLYAKCPFYALTGLYCPGCGTLRAIHQMLHGNFRAALALNPMAVIALPFVGCALLSQYLADLFGRPRPSVFIRPFWIWLLLGIIIAYWILRNIPAYPLTLLRPH